MTQAVTVYEASKFGVTASADAASRIVDVMREFNLGQFDLPQLRLPSGGLQTWEIVTADGPTAFTELDAIIGAATAGQRKWWRVPVEESDSKTPPDCRSTDGVTGFGINEESVSMSSQPEEHDCASCHWNQWGSDRRERAGKDCREFASLYIFREASAIPRVLTIPVTSLKNLKQYATALADEGRRMEEVVTRMTLERVDAKPAYSRVLFRRVANLDDDARGRMREVKEALKGAIAQSAAR